MYDIHKYVVHWRCHETPHSSNTQKAISLLPSLLSGSLQVSRCADHLLKIYLLLLRKSRHKSHSLHLSYFVSAGKFYLLPGYMQHLEPCIWCSLQSIHPKSAPCLQGPDKPAVVSCLILKQRVSCCPNLVGLLQVIIAFVKSKLIVSRSDSQFENMELFPLEKYWLRDSASLHLMMLLKLWRSSLPFMFHS